MSRKVTFAKLQTAFFFPGMGDLGNTLPPANKTLSEMDMHTTPDGLFLSFKQATRKFDLLIPYGNVIGMVLAPEAATEAPKKAK